MKSTFKNILSSAVIQFLVMLVYCLNIAILAFALWGPDSIEETSARDVLSSLFVLSVVILVVGFFALAALDDHVSKPVKPVKKPTTAKATARIASTAAKKPSKKKAKPAKRPSKKSKQPAERTYTQITRGKTQKIQTKAIRAAARTGDVDKVSDLVKAKLYTNATESEIVAKELIKRAKK